MAPGAVSRVVAEAAQRQNEHWVKSHAVCEWIMVAYRVIKGKILKTATINGSWSIVKLLMVHC